MSSETKITCASLPLSGIATHANLRCDAKYRLFWGANGDLLFPTTKLETRPLSFATVPYRKKLLPAGELECEHELIELEDVEKETGQVLSSLRVDEIKSSKLLFGDAHILTTRLRPNLGKTIQNDPMRLLIGTTEWIPLKVDPDRLHPKILSHLLLSPRYVGNAKRLLSGKEHPRISPSDLLALKVPVLAPGAQSTLVHRITEREQQISELLAGIKDDQTIIDEVLCQAFSYPLVKHRNRPREQAFSLSAGNLAAGFSLRASTRYHHPAFEIVRDFFASTEHKRVKNFITIPIRLGATAEKGDFLDEGEAFFVHPGATRKQGIIDLEDCYQVSEEFFNRKRRAELQPNDVIINRSGEAYGKVAYFDSEAPAVASDFTMRVRFNSDANPRFMWFFFRSVMFQTQIDREIKGSSVNNVFPSQIGELFVVNCGRSRQDELAEEIQTQLNCVSKARADIQEAQKSIQDAICDAMDG